MASKCSSHTLAFFFTILLMMVSVHHQVAALRDLRPEIQMLEQVILPNLGKKGCGHRCKTNDGCKPLTFCVSCEYVEKLNRTACVPESKMELMYGEEAAKATSEGLDAAGHAFGTAWTVFKIRKALNPKSALKPTTLAKSAAKAAAKAATADKKSSK